eukprot:13924.XXX_453500_453911_1 [CDS] Oithona nana genome sequencing.
MFFRMGKIIFVLSFLVLWCQAVRFEDLTPCEKAIWSCCQTDVGRFNEIQPLTECFEMNGCHGLHWTPNHGCLEETIMNIGKKLMM